MWAEPDEMSLETLQIPTTALKSTPIDVEGPMPPSDFHDRYIHDGGRPVILNRTGIVVEPHRLTFDYLKRAFGDTKLTASAPQFSGRTFDESKRCQVRMTASDYIDYLVDPTQEPKGTWERGNWVALQDLNIPLYCGSLSPSESLPPDHDFWTIYRRQPIFTNDWTHLLPKAYRAACSQRPVDYLFLAARGASTPLHIEFWDTHAYLAQITGATFCLLVSPDDTEHIYRGAIDPLAFSFKQYPLAKNATAWVGVLRPGQTLFVPSRWWYSALTLTTSIALGYNWCDSTNYKPFLRHALRYFWSSSRNRGS
jgi:hypothetical protein